MEENKMTASEFEQIKNKIAKEQENAMKAEGALDRIQQQLKQDFNIETDEQIEERMNALENKLDELNKRLDELIEKLESSVDWDSI
jgi:predicted AlkP superfamily phosphohydrolase/phosphomutase